MADEKVTTILQVELDAAKVAAELNDLSRQIANVKKEQKQLDDEYKAGKVSAVEYTKATASMKDELTWLQKQQKGVIATQKVITSTAETYSNTLNGQRQKLADMLKAYDQLDASFRDSKAGQKFKQEIDAQSEAVSKLEQATGRAQRNVGNYGSALAKLKQPLDMAKAGMSALAAHPLIAVLGALAALLFKLAERFKNNAAAMERLTGVFGAFHGIGVLVDRLIDKIAQGVGWLADKMYELAERFGLVSDAIKESKSIYEDELELHKKRRELMKQEADTEREVAELRNKVAQKDKYTSEERLGFLEKAIAKEKTIAEERKRIAQEEYDLIVRKNKQSESGQADLDKEAQAYVKLQAAETEYLRTTIRLQSQAASLAVEIKNEKIAEADATRQLNEQVERFLKNSIEQSVALDAELQKMQEARDMLAELNEEEEEAFVAPLTHMQQKIAELMQQGFDFATAQKIAAAQVRHEWAGAVATISGGMASAFGAVSDMFAAYADESEEAAVAAKAFGIAGVLASEAETIANGVKGVAAAVAAGAGVPFPANIPAIATGVAAVTSTIAGVIAGITQAKQILSQDAGNFSTGGTIDGTSYTGDKLIAHVNSGEGIYTGTQANNLLQEIANNPLRGGTEAMTEAIATALQSMPAPVLVLKELREEQDKVTTFNEIAKI